MNFYKNSNIIWFSFLSWMIISGILNINNYVYFMGNIVLLSLFIVLMIILKITKMNISQEYGKILYSYNNPTPISSMVDALSLKGYKSSNVKQIDFMSYDLKESCQYMKTFIPIIINDNDDISINIIGYGSKEDCQSLSNKNLSYFPTNDRIEKHKNLIYMKNGETFLWYEPSHKIENGKHYFKNGGYFIEPKEEVLKSIKKEITSLKEQSN